MTHPILAATSVIDDALKAVADTNPTFMPRADKAEALRELGRIESRVAELRMRVLGASSDLATDTGARDAAGWYADATRTRFEDARPTCGWRPPSTAGGRPSPTRCATGASTPPSRA